MLVGIFPGSLCLGSEQFLPSPFALNDHRAVIKLKKTKHQTVDNLMQFVKNDLISEIEIDELLSRINIESMTKCVRLPKREFLTTRGNGFS